MLHTKFQGHMPFGSGEEYFSSFLSYMDMAAFLVKWSGPFEHTFVPLPHGFNRLSGFRGKDVWKCWQHTHVHTYIHTYKRTTKAYLYDKLTTEPKGSGELKICFYTGQKIKSYYYVLTGISLNVSKINCFDKRFSTVVVIFSSIVMPFTVRTSAILSLLQ